jgi:hypothetical protein
MTAIALLYTEAGFVIAADGRARYLDENNPIAKSLPRKDTWNEQKTFPGVFCGTEVAIVFTGSAFNYNRSYELIAILRKAISETNDTYSSNQQPSIGKKLAALTSRLHSLLSDVKRQGALSLVSLPPVIAQIFIVGYFGDSGEPATTVLKLSHSTGLLLTPDVWTQYPPVDVLAGSQEISSRYLDRDDDKRFLRHFHSPGPSLDDGLAYTTGFIEACKDEMAKTVDPDIHDRISGHIHTAVVTPSGFQWRTEPVVKT